MTSASLAWMRPLHAMMQCHVVPASEAAARLAADVAERLRAAIVDRGRAVLNVSGGRSPEAFFAALRRQALDWPRVIVSLVDERCVPRSHAHSNARLVAEILLQGPAAAARFVPLVAVEREPLPSPDALCQQAQTALQAVGPADVTVLGMGSDGHIASLFPTARGIGTAIDPDQTAACAYLDFEQPPAGAPHPRISQTFSWILGARALMLPLAGADKIATLHRAFSQPDAALPVSLMLHQQRTPICLYLSP